MAGRANQVNGRGSARVLVGMAMAGILALVSVSCHGGQEPGERVRVSSARPHRAENAKDSKSVEVAENRPAFGLVSSILDPRVKSLLRAAESWRRSRGPERSVVDQVYLVPDLTSFLEVIAAWDERSFFPILIDDPAYTLPFLRAFRPARVVRIVGDSGTSKLPAEQSVASNGESPLWTAAQRAVARAWTAARG